MEFLPIDTSLEESTSLAAKIIKEKYHSESHPIYGIVNNAGVGFADSASNVFSTNVYGPHNVNEAFIPLLQPDGGRIVHMSSGLGKLLLIYIYYTMLYTLLYYILFYLFLLYFSAIIRL